MNNRFKKVLFGGAAFALAAALGCALVGCGSEAAEEEEEAVEEVSYTLITEGCLTIGSDLDYAPMEYMDEDSNPAGFSVALMQEICDRLGLECVYLTPQNFDTLLTQVVSATTCDVAASSFTINDERLELVDFSDSYFDCNQAVVMLAGSGITSADDLEGLILSAQSGTTGEEWCLENYPDAEYVPFTTISDALAALRSGSVEAIVYDDSSAAGHVSAEYTDCEIIDTIATGEQYGIAVNKENPGLLAAINAALAEIKADGTYDELYQAEVVAYASK